MVQLACQYVEAYGFGRASFWLLWSQILGFGDRKRHKIHVQIKQVTCPTPIHTPLPFPSPHTQKTILNAFFVTFLLVLSDQWMDPHKDQWLDQ